MAFPLAPPCGAVAKLTRYPASTILAVLSIGQDTEQRQQTQGRSADVSPARPNSLIGFRDFNVRCSSPLAIHAVHAMRLASGATHFHLKRLRGFLRRSQSSESGCTAVESVIAEA